MKNRLEENGRLAPAKPLKESFDAIGDTTHAVKAKLEEATTQVSNQITGLVKSAPGKSVLIALAAGIALGFWVKRK